MLALRESPIVVKRRQTPACIATEAMPAGRSAGATRINPAKAQNRMQRQKNCATTALRRTMAVILTTVTVAGGGKIFAKHAKKINRA